MGDVFVQDLIQQILIQSVSLTSITRQGTRTGKVEIDNLFVKGEGAAYSFN